MESGCPQVFVHDAAPKPVTTIVGSADVPNFSGHRVILSYTAASSTERNPASNDSNEERTHHRIRARDERGELFALAAGDAVAVQVTPILDLNGVMFCPIGLDGMINAGGAVERVTVKARGAVIGDWSETIADVLDSRWAKVKAMGAVSKIRVDIRGCAGSVFVAFADPLPKACAVIVDERNTSSVRMCTLAEDKLVKVELPKADRPETSAYRLVFTFS